MKKIKEYHVIYTTTIHSLIKLVRQSIADGWQPVGSHQVTVQHIRLVYSGNQHKESIYLAEYSQTMVR